MTSTFHGEFSSADASALSEPNSRFTLYGQGGVTALTLGTGDYAVVTDVFVAIGATSRTVTIYDGSDNSVGAGEQVVKATPAANTSFSTNLGSGHTSQKATYPKLITSGAGQVDAVIRGYIIRAGL